MKKPIVFSVISRKSNTGKTTLIEGIIPILKSRGYKVMTIKYSCYDFEADYEGTDSYKHFDAGSQRTVIIGPTKFVTFEKAEEHMDVEKIIETYNDVDIIITEGFRNINKPTIEVIRECKGTKIYTNHSNLAAIASDVEEIKSNVPVFDLNDYNEICNFIEDYYLTKKIVNFY
jgi:molybdopterin-guanine dinucleotide biosynthesis protein MobB